MRRIQLLGLAAAVLGVSSGTARAEDVTITTATTTPVTTADPNPVAPVDPGNVTIAAGGSIAVTAGQTAVTVNSNNNVTNAGSLTSNDANNSTGILLSNGFSGAISNTGAITLIEAYTLTDADNDGDLDGAFATGTNRNGILLSPGAFTGNITSAGPIQIEGQNSAGIRLDGRLAGDGVTTGNLNVSGLITLIGENSHGVLIGGGAAGGVAGDVFIRGGMTVRGQNSTGLTVDAPIDGQLRLNGNWSVTAYHAITPPSDTSHLDADDTQQSGSAVEVHFGVADGITIEGTGVEDDTDDDGDLVTEAGGDTNDDTTALIQVIGSAPTIHIQADASADLVLGATASTYGLWNRGTVLSNGSYDNVEATALRIEGNGIRTVTTAAGIANDLTMAATAHEANAYGIFIGGLATVPTILNRGVLNASVISENTDSAYAIYLDNNATVGAITNSGTIRARLLGEVGSATAIFDDSNSLNTITNSGSIIAEVVATDADPTDNVDPVAVGPAVAIDVSNSSNALVINQIADVAFTDDDATDDDALVRPAVMIQGDIRLGSGGDTINLLAGSITGDISFNGGADSFTINNGAEYHGVIDDSDNSLSLNVINGLLDLHGGSFGVASASFGADATLRVNLSGVPADPAVIIGGPISFAAGAQVVPVVPAGLPVSDTQTFLTSSALTGGANVIGPVTGEDVSFLYHLSVALTNPLAPDGAANGLEASYQMKTTTELGLSANQTVAFNPIIAALRLDPEAAAAMAGIDNAFDFNDAYEDLMPSYASGATELAATAIQQMQGATSNRLAATRLHDLHDVSLWAQEIGYGLTREPPDVNGQEFRGHGFGLAGGIDGPLDNGGLFGLSISFITSEVEEPGRPEGEISTSFGQANAYLGAALGPIDLDFIGGLGVGKMQSRRFVEIGDAFTARTDADWWSYEGHGAVRASLPMRLADWLTVTPQAALTYVALQESGYTEEGGGDAIDYDVDDAFSQRLWADAGVEFGARLRLRGDAVVAPRVFLGYRANAVDEEAERTFRFASTGDEFTLTDEGLGDGGPLVGIGIDATNGYSTFSLAYEGEFGDQVERHSLNAAIRFRF